MGFSTKIYVTCKSLKYAATEGEYDLASITKIIGTTLAAARAIAEGHMTLKTVPFSQWPAVTIEALLGHKSGLPAHRKLYEELALDLRDYDNNRYAIFDYLMSLQTRPTITRVYSDLGFMALGFYLEKLYKLPLFDIFKETWSFFGIDEPFFFCPSKPRAFNCDSLCVVPTGYCSHRLRYLRGQVHDTNCYYMGGLSGHAGLFGTLRAVAGIGQWFLRVAKNPLNEAEYLVAKFARLGLGFDKPSPKGTNRFLSPDAFGHFGYTGVSLWIDPQAMKERGLIIALLSNRTHCDERPEGIFWLRAAVNRAIISALKAS